MPGCQARGPYCGDGTVTSRREMRRRRRTSSTYGGASSTTLRAGLRLRAVLRRRRSSRTASSATTGGQERPGLRHLHAGCTLGPRCGDGDQERRRSSATTGVNNGSTGSACNANCTLKCGDGIVAAGRAVRQRRRRTTSAATASATRLHARPALRRRHQERRPSSATTARTTAPTARASPDCTLAPVLRRRHRPDARPRRATTARRTARPPTARTCAPIAARRRPYCGDKAVDGAFGETCDDGVNSGQPGSCTTDCKSYMPLSTCGDGTIDAGEQCDDGSEQRHR